MSSTRRRLTSLSPVETLDLESDLSLHPRLKLLLTFFRSDRSVNPVDEWQVKRSLLEFLRDSVSLSVTDDDLIVRKHSDLQKRKREDDVASGTLFVRDMSFLKKKKFKDSGKEEESASVLKNKFLEWKDSVVTQTNGVELNIQGVKFRLEVETPEGDDFDRLKTSWEDFYSWKPSVNRYSGVAARRPDTIIVKGVPSLWLAETRVSSKPSMLVTHTIFSAFGKIRNINVAVDDDLGKPTEEIKGNLVSGLHCKVWIQFENYEDFCGALVALCGRSLQKQGSRLRADYEVTWDRDRFFRDVPQTARIPVQERIGNKQVTLKRHQIDSSKFGRQGTTHFDEGSRPKRFRGLGACMWRSHLPETSL